mmetsp:Transcript_25839/g.21254  ORF Transcript_25839/g.21254 Transcript_25839/m.21254 type:complete len:171 (+) Transcript_25839:80-592(+)
MVGIIKGDDIITRSSSSTNNNNKDGIITLHISNLTRNINEDHLYEIFGTFCDGGINDIINIELAFDDKVNLPKGYAHITLNNKKAANDIIYYLNNGQIDGNIINIRLTHNNNNHKGGNNDDYNNINKRKRYDSIINEKDTNNITSNNDPKDHKRNHRSPSSSSSEYDDTR